MLVKLRTEYHPIYGLRDTSKLKADLVGKSIELILVENENQTEAGNDLDDEREGNHWMYLRNRCGRCPGFAV